MSESDFRDPAAQAEAEDSRARDESVTTADAGSVDDVEGMAAADGLTSSPEVAEHYREMTETGANIRGEGELP
ncbi:MAG TPA: hypothetical protein VNA12_01475 [Mycobacteriales bacterium]|nr:hypothetical protein [Mycobacteriales bacterium]